MLFASLLRLLLGISLPKMDRNSVNPLNAELNPIRHLLALVGARHIVHVSRVRVNLVEDILLSFKLVIINNKTGHLRT